MLSGWRCGCALVGLSWLLIDGARAEFERKGDVACYQEVCFPSALPEVGAEIKGISGYRYWGFYLYTAALYGRVGTAVRPDDVYGSGALELRLRYNRDFSAKDFIESGENFIKKTSGYDPRTMAGSLAEVNRLYEAVKKGDEYRIRYLPGEGFELRLNGRLVGRVAGDAFARAYLDIWLSEKGSIDESFTQRLLGGE